MKFTNATRCAILLVLLLSIAAKAEKEPVAIRASFHWQAGDIESAFAKAKRYHKPVLLDWGTKWCPSCLVLEATSFRDPHFIAETKNFIPIHVDGDTSEARVWGNRFDIRSFPTIMVLNSDELEIARISSSPTGAELTKWLQDILDKTGNVDAIIVRALSGSGISHSEWDILSNYAWVDETQKFKGGRDRLRILRELMNIAPQPYLKRRFALLAASINCDEYDPGATLARDKIENFVRPMFEILDKYYEVRMNRYELSHCGGEFVKSLPAGHERRELGVLLISAADKLYGDQSLSQIDRIDAFLPAITLDWKSAGGGSGISRDLLEKLKVRIATIGESTNDATARASFIPEAALVLHAAGDDAGAVKLLKAELPRSKTPYFYSHGLSLIGEWRGDGSSAVDYGRTAYLTAKVPLLRMEYAVLYSADIIRFFPDNADMVKSGVRSVIVELHDPEVMASDRSRRAALGWSAALKNWARKHNGSGIVASVSADLRRSCATAPNLQTGAECRRSVGTISASLAN